MGPLVVGSRVVANARLVQAGWKVNFDQSFPVKYICLKVPFLAASVRGEGAETVPGMMEALLLPPKPLDLEKYQAMAEDLAFELPAIQQQTGTKRVGSMDGGREGSPKQRREEVEDEEVRLGRDIGEVFPVGGVSGKIDRFLGVKTGEIVVMQPRQQPMRILFHVAQVKSYQDVNINQDLI